VFRASGENRDEQNLAGDKIACPTRAACFNNSMLKGALLCALAAMAAWADDVPKGKVIDSGHLRALRADRIYKGQRMAVDRRVRSTRTRTSSCRAVSNGGRNLRLHRRRVERFAQRIDGAKLGGRAGDADRREHALFDSSQANLCRGLSGGARVSFALAMGLEHFLGCDRERRGIPRRANAQDRRVPIFATTGTEDFNYLEMRSLDRELTSPHRVVVFEGGHTWLSSELAIEAVEWMELQAMKAGSRPKDDRLIGMLFTKRSAGIDLLRDEKEKYVATAALATDFDGLRDVTELAARAAALAKTKAVKGRAEGGSRKRRARVATDGRSIWPGA
jgi:hypothetical protein